MISSIVLVGTLDKKEDSRFRNIIVCSNGDTFHPENGYIYSKIALIHWTREDDSVLNKMNEGTRIIVRGHLESEEDVGLYVVCEYLEIVHEKEIKNY